MFGYGKVKNISLFQVLWKGEVLLYGVTTWNISEQESMVFIIQVPVPWTWWC